MAVTRIKNNQVTDASGANTQLGINANTKIQNFSITSGKLANNLTYGSDLTITGNLTVQGTSTAIDTTITTIEDPIIVLASTQTAGSPTVDIGFMGFRGNESNIAFVWDESADSFVTAFTSTAESNTTITITSLANLQVGNLSLTGNVLDAINVTGNITGGNLLTPGLISATSTITSAANITGANILTGGVVSATANVTGGNILTAGLISATSTITSAANVTGGNLLTAGLISATSTITSAANITGDNILTGGVVSATANVTGGNVLTGGVVSATANVTGGNILTAGLISATSTITSAANITGANILTGGVVSATANVTGGNLLTAGLISATSTITSAANVTGANITTTGGTFTGTLATTGDALVAGNLVVQGNITYINIDDLRVEDPVIILGTGPNGAPLTVNDGKDRGVFMEYFITAGNTLANAFMGYDNSTGNMFLATNVTMANDVVTVVTFGTLQAGNLDIQSAVSSGNITGGNLLTGGLISATGNITGGNINTAGNVTATTFIGNILGNIDAGGANTNIQFNDSDILAGSAGFTFDKTSNAVVANGNITGSNFNTAGLVTATGNVTGGNFLTGGLISATGNIITDEKTILLSSTSNAAAANLSGIKVGNSSGNIAEWVYNSAEFHWQTGNQGIYTIANVTANNVRASGLITATGNITGNNLSLFSGTLDGPGTGRITINGSNIDTDFAVNGNTLANVFYVDAVTGTASFGSSTQVTDVIVNFATTTAFKTPVGNTAQRPATGVTGMLRFNTTTNALEIYDNTQWDSVGIPVFTVIADEQFAGDGSTLAFTLGSTQTTNSCIVSINGVVQVPTVAYSVSGIDPTCVLTFTEAPISGDLIDVRQITTTTSVTQIVNTSGNALVAVTDTEAQVNITGNLVPSANVTFDLGTANLRWNDLYLAGNSIVLGNTVIKNTSGNSIGFFGPDGTTAATIDAASVDTTTIANGTSNVKVVSSNGNVTTNVNGTSNVMVISSTGAFITGVNSVSGNVTGGNVLTAGLISATGNITGSFILGNGSQLTGIDATSIQSGTSNVRVVSSGGNVATGIGGTSNVVVVATTGQFVTGVNSVSGNVTGGNILTAGDISATGNITGNLITGTLTTGSQTNITSVGTLGSLTVSGNLTSGGIAMSTANATIGNLFVTGTTTITGNITQVSGNTGQFFGNASTGFNALYAGLSAGFSILPQSVVNYVTQSNSYSQVNSQNQSAGAEATVDLVLTGDNGDDAHFFFDIGYTGSGYDPDVAVLNNALGNVVTPNDAYMYTTGNVAGGNPSHMVIGTVDTNSYVRFFVGGYYANATVMQLNAPNAANTVTITGGLTVGTGNVSCGNIVNTNANGVGNIGSTGTRFNQVFALASSAQYADLAEKYTADATYATGTVVAFGGAEEVTISAVDSDRRVAGVISALPSFRMNDGLQSEHTAMVALTGRVPTMVTGTVRKGDMMVSAGAGRARAEANPAIGTVIGKALADHDGEDGVIEVVVGRV